MSIFNWGIYLGFAASFGIAFITDQETWIYGYIVTGLSGLLVAVLLVLPAVQEYCSSKKSKPQGNIPEEGEALTDEVKENDIEKKQSWKDSVIGFFKNFVNFLDGKRHFRVGPSAQRIHKSIKCYISLNLDIFQISIIKFILIKDLMRV